MKITFIEPCLPGIAFQGRMILPRLGLPQLGAILKKAGHEVKIFSETIRPISERIIKDLMESDIVGFSVLTSTAPRAYELSQKIKLLAKKIGKKIKIIMGGPHATVCPEEPFLFGADLVVRHEGEEVINEAIMALLDEDEKVLSSLFNLSWKRGEEIVHNPSKKERVDLNKFPFPDLELIENFRRKGWFLIHRYPIETSRGCIFNCEFCSVKQIFPGGIKFREKEAVVEEMKRQERRGYLKFFFVDDNFLIDPERVAELLELLLRKEVKCKVWNAQISVESILRAQKIVPEVFELMRKTNAGRQFIGFESVSPETLKEYRKPQTKEKMEEAISILKRWKIPIHGMFVFGGDGDRKETFAQTLKFCLKNKLHSMWASILTPFPGTPLWERLKNEGRILLSPEKKPSLWQFFDGLHAVFKPKNFSPKELENLTFLTVQKFYHFSQIVKDIFSPKIFAFKLFTRMLLPHF